MKDKIKNKIFRRQTTVNLLIFSILVVFLLSFDLILKQSFFKFNGNNVTGKIQFDYKIIGIRSQAHTTTTFTDWFNIKSSNGLLITFSIIIIIVLFFTTLFSDKSRFAVAFSLLFIGVLGNTVDRIGWGYVRNVIFTPWIDKGTFNFADIIIVIGSINILILLLHKIFKMPNKKKERK